MQRGVRADDLMRVVEGKSPRLKGTIEAEVPRSRLNHDEKIKLICIGGNHCQYILCVMYPSVRGNWTEFPFFATHVFEWKHSIALY